MKRSWLLWFAVPAVAIAAFAEGSRARAADHADAPAVRFDRTADITDVFAFMSPDPAAGGHIVLIMNVTPAASATDGFSDAIDYVFRVRRLTSTSPPSVAPVPLDVSCTFSSGRMTCAAPQGLSASSALDQVGGAATDTMRVFAGRRADPFFFDNDAFEASYAAQKLEFTATGKNSYAGQNVLSIVVEIDAAKAFGITDGGAGAFLAVAGETRRTRSAP